MKRTNQILFTLIVLAFTGFSIQSCKHEVIEMPDDIADNDNNTDTTTTGGGGTGGGTIIEDPCDPDTIYFQNDVLPILISNCAISGCLDPETAKNGIILSTYEYVMSSSSDEDLVVPGNAEESEMIEKITEEDLEDRMPPPPYPPLSSEEINTLITWIEQGALNNSCGGDCDTTNVTYSETISNIITTYCLGCHGATASGGINLSTYEGVADVAADGSLYGAVSHQPGYTAMPLGGSMLPDCDIEQIRIWVENGFPND